MPGPRKIALKTYHMMQNLLTRQRGLKRSKPWHILPLLVALFLPFILNAASLPAKNPDYEFTVDNVIYKCYFDNKYESQNPTPTDKGTKYYLVYAEPADENITHAAIRLDWSWDLKNHIPTDEPGYAPCAYYFPTTQLVSGTWEKCTSLKYLELIVNIWSFNDDKINTTDLAPVSKLGSLKTIFVTGGKRYSWDTGTPYHIFTNLPDVTYYSVCNIYKDKHSYSYAIKHSYIDAYAKSLLIENTLDINKEACAEYGFTPKIILRPGHLTNSDPTYTFEYDENGKLTAPLIGKFKYNIGIDGLVDYRPGESLPYVITFENDIFENCFSIKKGISYETVVSNRSKIAQYGFSNILLYQGTYPKGTLIEKKDSYLLPHSFYYFIFTYKGMPMLYTHEVKYSTLVHSISTEAKWLPHCVTVSATIPEDILNNDDGAIIGIGEKDSKGNYTFVPFDSNGVAVLNDRDNRFDLTISFADNAERGEFCLKNKQKVELIISVKGQYIELESLNCPSDENITGVAYRNKQKIKFEFQELFNKKVLSESDKVGLYLDDKKYYAKGTGSNSVLETNDLLPNSYYGIQLFYEIGGIEYTSNISSLYTLKIAGTYDMNISTQSAAFTYKGLSCDESLGEITLENMAVYNNNKKVTGIQIEKTDPFSINVSGLTMGENYELRGNCQYRRKSDGEISRQFDIKILFVTDKPSWREGDAQAMNKTKARLTYSTNIENVSDSYVEWRRVDAPDVVKSSTAVCPVVNGRLVGILNNLNPDVYYKFRPVYEINGTSYYGEWIGIFTGDAYVWFDPELQTSPAQVKDNGSVTLRGSVVPGSGDITEQGFEVWMNDEPQSATVLQVSTNAENHTFITCNGISMSADMTQLKAGATYTYRTYAKVNGQTYNGPEMTFTIPESASVDEIFNDGESTITGYYNLSGIRSDKPFTGLNIIVYSNGKTEKRMF